MDAETPLRGAGGKLTAVTPSWPSWGAHHITGKRKAGVTATAAANSGAGSSARQAGAPAQADVFDETATTEPLSFTDWISHELGWGVGLPWRRRARPAQHVVNFLSVPLRLEPLLSFGHAMCVDLLLFQFTSLPIRCVHAAMALAMLTVKSSCKVLGLAWFTTSKDATHTSVRRGGAWPTFTRAHAYDLVRGSVVVCAVLALGWVQVSRVYHYIRGEAIIKLYVIFNILEIFDRLACSLGSDVMDALYRTTRDHLQLPVADDDEEEAAEGSVPGHDSGTAHNESSGSGDGSAAPSSGVAALRLAFHFCVAVFYVVAHSLILFVQVVCLNVAINSRNNALLTLLVSNNFVELKASVFKRFEAENLFQVSCADTVERFQVCLFLFLIALQELTSLDAMRLLLPSILAILACEVIVDYVKHSFISKFNRLHADLYSTFKAILSHDLVAVRARMSTSLDPTHTCVKRLGLATLPLAVVVIRMAMLKVSPDVLPRLDAPTGLLASCLLFACLLAGKSCLGMLLLSHAAAVTRDQKRALGLAADEAADLAPVPGQMPGNPPVVHGGAAGSGKVAGTPSADPRLLDRLSATSRYSLTSARIP